MLLKRERGKMPLPAQQPREPLFTTCVKRIRNGSFCFKNLFLAPFRGLEKRDFPGYRPAPGIRVGIRPCGWLRGASRWLCGFPASDVANPTDRNLLFEAEFKKQLT